MPRNEICLVSGIYPPDIGGPAKFTVIYNRWLRSNSIDTTVITLTDSDDVTEIDGETKIKKISRKHNLINRYFRSILAIYQQFLKNRVVLANGMFLETFIASIFSRGQYVAKVPGDIVWERARNSGYTSDTVQNFQKARLPLKFKVFRIIFSLSLMKAKAVIVPSQYLYDFCLNWGINKSRLHLIHNAISLNNFPFRPHAQKNIDVLCVSRLTNLKGLPEVIEITNELNLSLTIAGTGPEMDALMVLTQSLKANVNFIGDVEQSALPDLYARARYFVLNSQFESTSYSLLEARAVGTFSISNLGTGSEEVIRHLEDGLLCGLGNRMSLKEALLFALNNPEFVDSAILKARMATEENFDLHKTYKRILNLL